MGVFETRISGCVVPRNSQEENVPSAILEKAITMQLPHYKPFNLKQFLDKKNNTDNIAVEETTHFDVYPNPSSDGNFIVRFQLDSRKPVDVTFTDLFGKIVSTAQFNGIQGENYFALDLSTHNLSSGVYIVTLKDDQSRVSKKVVIKK
jgi:hypothetical protein